MMGQRDTGLLSLPSIFNFKDEFCSRYLPFFSHPNPDPTSNARQNLVVYPVV